METEQNTQGYQWFGSPKDLSPENIADRLQEGQPPLDDFSPYDFQYTKGLDNVEFSLIVNDDDPDLKPITIDISRVIQDTYRMYNTIPPATVVPLRTQIDGHDLYITSQKFHHPVLPEKLRKLQKNCETINDMWDALEEGKEQYKDEITWIAKQWYHRLYGYWFYNNGVPTYITGKHYFYLGFWEIDVGLPKYFSRDRKYWLFTQFCRTDRTDFVYKDEKGNAIPDADGSYKMFDTGKRICFGFVYPKFRREGATYKAECDNFETISKLKNAQGGIQSRNDKDAKDVFKTMLVTPFKRLIKRAFFFVPLYEGSTNPKEELSFDVPAVRVGGKGSSVNIDVGLLSFINFEVANEGAYDGKKLYFDHGDEEGKNKDQDVLKRHNVKKKCLSQEYNTIIHGFCVRTSTVGEMEKGGGANFKRMCDSSDYYRRNENGQTVSGMYLLFIPSYDGLLHDEYGNSKIEESKKVILKTRKGFENIGDYVNLCEEVRNFPIAYRECFMSSQKSSGFNIKILNDRINELRFDREATINGDFVWRERDRFVDFVPSDDGRGRFNVSLLLPPSESNKFSIQDNVRTPLNQRRFSAGADPFRFNETKNAGKSNGGGAVFWKFDSTVDKMENDVTTWKSNRFVCDYSYRPMEKKDYLEDMLKMCVYYGAMMYPENNIDYVPEYFERRGYAGYLKYDIDKKTMMFEVNAGTTTTIKSKQELFNEYMDYIQVHGMRDRHIEILNECLQITGVDDMTHWDRFTAGGYALLGARNYYDEIIEQSNESADIENYMPKFVYGKRR